MSKQNQRRLTLHQIVIDYINGVPIKTIAQNHNVSDRHIINQLRPFITGREQTQRYRRSIIEKANIKRLKYQTLIREWLSGRDICQVAKAHHVDERNLRTQINRLGPSKAQLRDYALKQSARKYLQFCVDNPVPGKN